MYLRGAALHLLIALALLTSFSSPATGRQADDQTLDLSREIQLLDDAADAYHQLAPNDRRLHIPDSVLNQYLRSGALEKAHQLCRNSPHMGYVALRGVAKVGERYAQQGKLQLASAAIETLFELEAEGCSESNPNYMRIAKAVVANLSNSANYDQAMLFVERLPVWAYQGSTLTQKQIEGFHLERQSSLIKQVILQALENGDLLRATTAMESLTPEYRKRYSGSFAVALARIGAYDLAHEQLTSQPKSYRRQKTIRAISIAICRRGDFNAAVTHVRALDSPDQHDHLALIVDQMYKAGAEPQLRRTLVNEILKHPNLLKEIQANKLRVGDLLLDHMLDGGEESRFMEVFSTTFRNELLFSADQNRLRRRFGEHMLAWIRDGQLARFDTLASMLDGNSIEQAKRRRGFYRSILGRLNHERRLREKAKLPDQDQPLRELFARRSVQAWTMIPADDPDDKSFGTEAYDSMADWFENDLFQESMRYLRDAEPGNHLYLKSELAAAMLLHLPTPETDQFLDRYLTNSGDGSMYGSHKFLIAKLRGGFDESAANYYSKLSLENENSFLISAMQSAIGTPAVEPLCKLLRRQWKGDWRNIRCDDWATNWFQMSPAEQLSTSEILLKYYPALRWAKLKRCQALASLGRVEQAVKECNLIDPADRGLFHFQTIVDSLCHSGHAVELAVILETLDEPHKALAMKKLCPFLAKKDPTKAIEIAKSIKEPGDRAYALSQVVSVILDKKLGTQK